MERRDFLAAGLSMAGTLATRSAQAQPVVTRAAVVVGIDQVGTARPLKAARAGARAMAAWLKGEGFDVKLLVDEPNGVKANDVYDAVNAYVQLDTVEQLVIYFGGHGFLKGTGDEYGLLPGALDNPNEAINLTESQKYAWYANIRNVVFISDACRSRAESLQIDAISGSSIFPHRLEGGDNQVDTFLATAIGLPAFEAKLRASDVDPTGIYTDAFLEAFRRPYASSVKMVDGKAVVTNRLLPSYLVKQVPLRALAATPPQEQHPSARICSSDTTYIGRVLGTERAPEAAGTPTVSDVGTAAVGAALGTASPFSAAAINAAAEASGFDAARATIEGARGLSAQVATRSGIAVSGQRVDSVTTRPGIRTLIRGAPGGERPSALVEVDVQGPHAASVALRFPDGTGTVVAALDNFVANVVVDDGRVVSVSYEPSRLSPLRGAFESEQGRLAQMRVVVATAAQFGVFRIEGAPAARSDKAKHLAGSIRLLKGIDPTLGIYAAYAYADVNILDQVRSVRSYMRDNLDGIDLFDVAMLAGDLTGKPPGADRVFPFCPMLSQGWGYLRFKDVRLPEGVAPARDHLRHSLWLTLDPEGMRIVEAELHAGRVA